MEMPDGKSIIALIMGLGFIGQAVGFSIPTFNRANANRDANWAARDMLAQCHDERDDLLHALINERHARAAMGAEITEYGIDNAILVVEPLEDH